MAESQSSRPFSWNFAEMCCGKMRVAMVEWERAASSYHTHRLLAPEIDPVTQMPAERVEYLKMLQRHFETAGPEVCDVARRLGLPFTELSNLMRMDLYNLNRAFEELGDIAAVVRAHVQKEFLAALNGPTPAAELEENDDDALNEPNVLRWRNEPPVDMQIIPWRLLKSLWPGKKLREDEMITATWGVNEEPSIEAIKTAQKKANQALAEARTGKQIYRKNGLIELR